MNKKQTIKKTAAMLLGLAIAMGTTGCGFITTDSQADLNQTVAEVKIEGELAKEDSGYAAIAKDFKNFKFSGEIKKRELISYYISIGYQYVQNYGYSKEDTYNMLLNALVNREILGQEAAAYFLSKDASLTSAAYKTFKEAELNKDGVKGTVIADLLNKYEDVLRFKYFLTKGDANNTKEYDIAVYTLKKNINDSLDSLEQSYIEEESEDHTHEETRTLPNGINTEIEDYYASEEEGYDVYTGRNAADPIVAAGYKKVEGSTVASRQKAYNAFLTNLQDYNLVSTTGKVEDTSKIENLEYYYVELASLLEQRLINNYYEALEETVNLNLDETYVGAKYNEMFAENKRAYEEDPTAFASAMDSASADSFLLYAPNNKNGDEDMVFGYVYNILLPFSTSQNVKYTEAKNAGLSERELFMERKAIATDIKGKDLRSSWISMHEHAGYQYEESEGVYKFFKDNDGSGRYEGLSHYLGNYAFNGNVTPNADGDEYEITYDDEHKLNIDQFMTVFEDEINKAVGSNVASGAPSAAYNVTDKADYYTTKDGKEVVDYSKFIYYTGKVALSNQTAAGFFDEMTDQYKALSAVNELMFAYSTDTGCLNTYMGYSVSPYGTNFVKEFEKTAQDVVKEGVGSYAVCLTDYGWHIIYCSFSYKVGYMGENGDVYGGYVEAEKDTEGTFSNLFYEYVKESAYTNYTTEVQNKTLKKYDNDDCITRYENRYNDLFKD